MDYSCYIFSITIKTLILKSKASHHIMHVCMNCHWLKSEWTLVLNKWSIWYQFIRRWYL